MRYILFITVLITTTAFTKANQIDSLKDVISKTPAGSEKVELYNKLYKELKKSNLDTALYYLEKQKNLARRIGDTRTEGLTFLRIGLLNKVKGNYDLAIENYLTSARIFKSDDHYKLYAAALNNLGNILLAAGNYDGAIKFFTKASTTYEYLEHSNLLVSTYLNLGQSYFNLDKHESSRYYYNQALKLSLGLESPELIFKSYNYLGELEKKECYYEQSRNYYLAALNYTEQINDTRRKKATLHNNIGGVFLKEGKLTSAEDYFLKALNAKRVLDDNNSQLITLSNLGDLELRQGNIRQSIAYLEEGIAKGDRDIVNQYLTDAISLLKIAYDTSRINGSPVGEEKWSWAHGIYEKQMQKVISLKNSLKSEDIQNVLYYRIELDKKNAKIEEIAASKERNDSIMYVSIAFLFGALFLYYQSRKNNKLAKQRLDEANKRINKAVGNLNEIHKIASSQLT